MAVSLAGSILTKLWERKASVDVADTLLIRAGTPYAWFFTSSVTGVCSARCVLLERNRVDRAHLARHLSAHQRSGDPEEGRPEAQRDRHQEALCAHERPGAALTPARCAPARTCVCEAVPRFLAVLLTRTPPQEDRDGSIKYSALSDLEFNAVLCQPSSPLWMASFLLQPFSPRGHGTFVAKFNALATSSCVRVLPVGSYFYDLAHATPAARPALLEKSPKPTRCIGAASAPVADADREPSLRTSLSGDSSSSSSSRPMSAGGATGVSHPLEEIIKAELKRLVREIESAFKDKLRLLNGEFRVTSTNRLVLVRVSHVVFFSDLKVHQERSSGTAASERALKTQRPMVSLRVYRSSPCDALWSPAAHCRSC